MKIKLSAFALAIFFAIVSSPVRAQVTCNMPPPSQQWEEWFSDQVHQYLEKKSMNKSAVVNYTIPVIVHILHNGETIGTFPNIDSNEVKSQIAALNEDFAGIGFNSSNVPAEFAGLKANTGIKFCLAAIDYTGSGMIEHGCNRINVNSFNWENLATATLNLPAYMNATVIPATIWPPDRYLNIWISDKPAGEKLNAFSTYPPNSSQIGLFAEQPYGTATNDGIWCWARAFGTMGSAQAPTNKGRTVTHHVGHWLGLRHPWGDGNCLSDYVSDTPTQKGPYTGCPTGKQGVNNCGVNSSPHGEMYMNFMNDVDDACKYMFTQGQNVRMQTALNHSPLRNPLGSHGLCQVPSTAPSASAVASFTSTQSACVGSPFLPFNTSSGHPSPTFLWSSTPGAQFQPNASAVNPMVTFNNPGSYTLSLVASNSVSSSTYTYVVSAQFTCNPEALCLDSVKMVKDVDTLVLDRAPVNMSVFNCQGPHTGHLVGTNCYQDREFAQYYPPSNYTTIPQPQINSLIVLFDSAGTGNSGKNVYAKIYSGTPTFGPTGILGQPVAVPLSAIKATPPVDAVTYLGKPGFVQANRKIIPYKFNFSSPVVVTSTGAGFFAAIEIPNSSFTSNDSVAILHSTRYNTSPDSTSWYMNLLGSWRSYQKGKGANIQMAMIPEITCSPIMRLPEHAMMSGKINVVPNPGSGLFNLVFTFDEPQKEISIRVMNAIGQVIVHERIGQVQSAVYDLDLTGRSEGIYFAEIGNGTERVVKKVVVAR